VLPGVNAPGSEKLRVGQLQFAGAGDDEGRETLGTPALRTPW
jgi:hypothetical protein